MIARPHICLRCQYSLSRRSALSEIRVAFISTHLKRKKSNIVPDYPEHEEERIHAPVKRPLKLSRRPLGPQNHISEHPLGKLYGYTGQQLRENREKLGVDVLGEAAEVIVLRDSKIRNYTQSGYEESLEAQEGIDILAKLDEERGLVGWTEVEGNINDFRPIDGRHPQTREEFGDLLKGLQNGFTVPQLTKYLQTHGRKDLADLAPITASLALRMSPWIPGVSESDERLDDDHLRGYDLESYTSKQRLVLRLLRECWKLELPFVEEGVGQIEVEIKPADLDLLLDGRKSPLSDIHSKYIVDRDERLEIFRSNDAKRTRNAIRITATRTKSYQIVQEIEQKLKSIHRIQLPLKALVPKQRQGKQSDVLKWVNTQFDGSVIKELARLTNTVIRKTSGGSLLIASVDPNAATALSSNSDSARRLIITAGNFSERNTSWVGCKETANAEKGIFVKYPLVEGLGWRERFHQWSRWVTPISKDAINEKNKDQIPPEEEKLEQTQSSVSNGLDAENEARSNTPQSNSNASHENSIEHKPRRPEERSANVAFWSEEFVIQSSALMGTVLYAQPQSSKTGSERRPLFADATRCFSTAVPGISRLLAAASASNVKPTESIVMRFLPNPFFSASTKEDPIGAAALSAFPPVEMRFAVDPTTEVLGLNSVQAVVSNENSDLMLPDSPMDIRFQQKTTSRLFCDQRSLPPGIGEFLNQSNLGPDFLQRGVQTPSLLKVPIAAHLCTKDAFKLLGLGQNKTDVQDVEYLFAGLEIRKTISTEFEGWRLLYTSVEGGKAGGRRGELRLLPVRTVESENPKPETEEAFLEAAFQLADSSYTTEASRVTEKLVKRLVTYKDRQGLGANRTFKYFAKRPTILLEWEQRSSKLGEETGKEVLHETWLEKAKDNDDDNNRAER